MQQIILLLLLETLPGLHDWQHFDTLIQLTAVNAYCIYTNVSYCSELIFSVWVEQLIQELLANLICAGKGVWSEGLVTSQIIIHAIIHFHKTHAQVPTCLCIIFSIYKATFCHLPMITINTHISMQSTHIIKQNEDVPGKKWSVLVLNCICGTWWCMGDNCPQSAMQGTSHLRRSYVHAFLSVLVLWTPCTYMCRHNSWLTNNEIFTCTHFMHMCMYHLSTVQSVGMVVAGNRKIRQLKQHIHTSKQM